MKYLQTLITILEKNMENGRDLCGNVNCGGLSCEDCPLDRAQRRGALSELKQLTAKGVNKDE